MHVPDQRRDASQGSSPARATPARPAPLPPGLSNRAMGQVLAREPNFFKRLFGRGGSGKQNRDVQISAPPSSGGRVVEEADPYKSVRPSLDWLDDRAWQDVFLNWQKKVDTTGHDPEKKLSPFYLDVFTHLQRLLAKKHKLRSEVLKFMDDVLKPRLGDPLVRDWVAGLNKTGTFDSLRAQVAGSDWEAGVAVLNKKMERMYYRVNQSFARFIDWAQKNDANLPLPPGRRTTPASAGVVGGHRGAGGAQAAATPAPAAAPAADGDWKPPRPMRTDKWNAPERSDGRLTPGAREALKKADLAGGLAKSANWDKAKSKLAQCHHRTGELLQTDELDTALERVIAYIREAKATINFGKTQGEMVKELMLFESLGGRTPVWTAPEGATRKEYLDKRQRIEQKFFGYADDPRQSGKAMDRPVYAAANVGNAVQGAAENWGKSYLVMKSSVRDRATYAHTDTYQESTAPPTIATTAAHLEAVVADMPVEKLEKLLQMALGERAAVGMGGVEYIEMHVFGGIDFAKDVEKLVIDRATVKEGSKLDQHVQRFARMYGLRVEYYNAREWEEAASKDVRAANAAHGPKRPLPKPPARQAAAV